MNQTFIDVLRRIIEVLNDYAEPLDQSAMKWDGRTYTTSSPNHFDPYAARWWATLTAVAEMIGSESPSLPDHQKKYLDRLLFGGMGSLNDFAFDERKMGTKARQANDDLTRLRKELFELFMRM